MVWGWGVDLPCMIWRRLAKPVPTSAGFLQPGRPKDASYGATSILGGSGPQGLIVPYVTAPGKTAFPSPFIYWLNWAPCGCRDEALIPCWPSAPGGHLHSGQVAPSSSKPKSQTGGCFVSSEPSHTSNLFQGGPRAHLMHVPGIGSFFINPESPD